MNCNCTKLIEFILISKAHLTNALYSVCIFDINHKGVKAKIAHTMCCCYHIEVLNETPMAHICTANASYSDNCWKAMS